MRTYCRYVCIVLSTVAACVLPVSADTLNQFGGTYANWPTDWTPISGINDAKDTGIAAQLDFVGDSAFPGGYWTMDANYVYFRARVAAATVTTSTYRDTIWVLIDKVGYGADDGRPDYGLGWDSKSNNNNNHGLEMQILQTKGDSWQHTRMDDIDGSDGQKLTRDINGTNSTQRTGEGYVRTIDSQNTTTFGMTSFIDFAVSWSYLSDPAKGNTALGKNQQWKITFGSIANATDHNPITADVAGGANPSDPVTVGWTKSLTAPAIALSNAVNDTVIRGGTGTLGVTVDNSAPSGYDNLNYTLVPGSVTGVTYGAITPGPAALGPDGTPVAHTFTATTSESTPLGPQGVLVTGSDTQASNNPQTLTATLTVMDHADAEFVGGSGNTLNLDFGILQKGTGSHSLQYRLTNLLADYRVKLDLDSFGEVLDPSGVFSSSGATFKNLTAGDVSSFFDVSMATTTLGTFHAKYQFLLSDQDGLSGSAGGQILTLNVSGQVVPEPATLSLFALAGLAALIRRRKA